MTSKPKSWRDLLPVHPAAELFPMMSEEELRSLGEDIKKNGLREGVALLDGKLLDGRNRLEAMEAVGIKLTTGNGQIEWAKISSRNVKGTDPIAFVISKNIHRRHLTADQKRDVIAKVLKATPEKSNRQIAETVKVDHKTVAAVRAEKVATGEIPQLTKTVGKDGKARKALTKPTTKSPAFIAAADRAEARADRTAQVPDAPNALLQPDDPDDSDEVVARMIDELTGKARLTVDFIERERPAQLKPLRDGINSIFRQAIEARAPAPKINSIPTNPGKSDDDLAVPPCLMMRS
jgi:hypothetical protein